MPLTEEYDDAEASAGAEVKKARQKQRLDVPDNGLCGWCRQTEQESRRYGQIPPTPDVPESETADHQMQLQEPVYWRPASVCFRPIAAISGGVPLACRMNVTSV